MSRVLAASLAISLGACAGSGARPPKAPAPLTCGEAWMLVGESVNARGEWVRLPLGELAQVSYADFVIQGTRSCRSADLIEANFEVRGLSGGPVVARPKVLWRLDDVAAACFAITEGTACISVCSGRADCDRLRGVR